MKMNLSNLTMMNMLMMTVMLTLSSNNILNSWMMMEINLISFMPLISKSKKMNEQIMKYFIMQSMASSMMMMSIMMSSILETPLNNSIIMMLSMMIKLGLMPTHIWMPLIMKELSWKNCLMMMTMQKIIPIILTCQMIEKMMMNPVMQLTLIISPVTTINQTSLKKIMSYSSIANTPWMLMSMYQSIQTFILFMSTYSIIMMMSINHFKKINMLYINQINQKSYQNSSTIMIMLTMTGIPPTVGFLPKWITLQEELSQSLMNSTFLVASSMLMTFIYMKMLSPSMLINKTWKKMNIKNELISENLMMNMLGLMILTLIKSN